MHMIMWAMSDRAMTRSLRMIEGLGHTFRLVDAKASDLREVSLAAKLGMQSVNGTKR